MLLADAEKRAVGVVCALGAVCINTTDLNVVCSNQGGVILVPCQEFC